MKTLSGIVEAAERNQPVDALELRYAVVALVRLLSLDLLDLQHEACRRGADSIARSRYEAAIGRHQRALKTDPKTWLGPSNDPADPEVVRRRVRLCKLADAVIRKENGR